MWHEKWDISEWEKLQRREYILFLPAYFETNKYSSNAYLNIKIYREMSLRKCIYN